MADGQVVLVTTEPLDGSSPVRSVYFVAEQNPETATNHRRNDGAEREGRSVGPASGGGRQGARIETRRLHARLIRNRHARLIRNRRGGLAHLARLRAEVSKASGLASSA